jgi:DNA-binding GntR family transcriptional regulator
METVTVGQTRVPRNVRNFFGLTNDDDIVLLRRVRTLRGVPVYYLENFLPTGIAKEISLQQLRTTPLLEILSKKFPLAIERGELFIEAVPAEPDVAHLLRCGIFEPVASILVFYSFPSAVPFEIVNCFVRGDRFKYKVTLDRIEWSH